VLLVADGLLELLVADVAVDDTVQVALLHGDALPLGLVSPRIAVLGVI